MTIAAGMSHTCHTCGSVLLWSNGQLVCPRRGCAGMSTAAGFTLTTDLRTTNQGDTYAN